MDQAETFEWLRERSNRLDKVEEKLIKCQFELARLRVKPIVDAEKKGEEIGDLMNLRLDAQAAVPAPAAGQIRSRCCDAPVMFHPDSVVCTACEMKCFIHSVAATPILDLLYSALLHPESAKVYIYQVIQLLFPAAPPAEGDLISREAMHKALASISAFKIQADGNTVDKNALVFKNEVVDAIRALPATHPAPAAAQEDGEKEKHD